MIINHNMNAMNAHRQMVGNTSNAGKSMEKLSSGLRINRAGDDAAGLAISEKMRGQIRGLDQASRNSQDSISMIQTAEGALNETHSILQRMRELAVQSSNDTNNSTDRKAIQDETKQLADEIDRIGNTTEFNTKKLLNGSVEGVVEEKKGSANINNNTAMGTLELAAGMDTIVEGGAQKNGAYTITRIDKTGANGTAAVADFTVIDNMGNKLTATGNFSVGANTTFTLLATGGVAQAAKGTAVNLTFDVDFSKMAVGESFTIVFNKHEAAKTNTDSAITAQIGANSGQTMQIGISDMRAEALGVKDSTGKVISVEDKYSANSAVSTIQNAIEKVSAERSKLGAAQNRLEHTINNLGTASENLQSSESRIRDVDMAKEMMNFSKNNILSQASQAMLAQAKSQPEQVLQLLR